MCGRVLNAHWILQGEKTLAIKLHVYNGVMKRVDRYSPTLVDKCCQINSLPDFRNESSLISFSKPAAHMSLMGFKSKLEAKNVYMHVWPDS